MPLNPPLSDWRGRTVWIVGASAGIGAELARELLARGANVALSARNEAALREVAGAKPEAALVAPLDVTVPASIEAARDRIVERFGGIDLAVAVAGDYVPMRADDFDAAAAQRLMAINLGGVLNLLGAVLPGWLARGRGGIAIVASVAGYRGLPRALAYGPTKAALINLAETLYLDLAPRGLQTYLVCPGFVRTRLTAQNEFAMPDLIDADAAAREIVRGIESGCFEIAFPWRFSRILKVLRVLPYRWYFALVRRRTGA
jgi:NAD(P)-dependent dehydrogenase (short-subunit alcohol dehydrogenase family)